LDSTAAILLRKTRYSDTSLIVSWFTAGHGKIKTIAKGALRPKSRFAGTLDLFYECEIAISRSPRSDLHTLREAVLSDSRENLRRDYPRVALAAYFVELLDLATEPDHSAPELFDLLSRALRHLDQKPPTRRALEHYENELTRLLGIQHPDVSPIVAIGRAYHRVPSSRPDLLKLIPE
jgi:DNA repair protein RecO (recombination protein O)